MIKALSMVSGRAIVIISVVCNLLRNSSSRTSISITVLISVCAIALAV